MVEKLAERKKEPEPRETKYDTAVRELGELARQTSEGKVVLKGKEINFEQNRQGFIKYYIQRGDWDKVATPGWSIFINRIQKHSGKHVHQGGLALFVLDGEGFTVVDGEKFEWKTGDLILLPVKPGGVEHQHFSRNPDQPAEWMAFIFHSIVDAVNMGIIQKAEHPDWARSK
ncbi:MAG: cupin domain-containing protein [Chloroflexi bacterium]|nr:cupin domain-containing protein [Chloroflexota bacterium]